MGYLASGYCWTNQSEAVTHWLADQSGGAYGINCVPSADTTISCQMVNPSGQLVTYSQTLQFPVCDPAAFNIDPAPPWPVIGAAVLVLAGAWVFSRIVGLFALKENE